MFKIFVDFAKINKNIMINCERNLVKTKKDFPYNCFVKFDKYQQTLMSNLDLTSKEARALLWNKQDIFNMSLERIAEQCQLCNRLNVNPKELIQNGGVLLLTSQLLEHRILLFREMGVQKSEISFTSNFHSAMSMHMALFKAWGGIPKDENIAKNLLRYLHQPPPHIPPLEELSDELSVQEYRVRCLKWYIMWKFNMSKDNEELINQLVDYIRHNSFSHARGMLDLLQYDVGLTIDKIQNYCYLSNGKPDDLQEMIEKVQTFCGISIKELIKEEPRLLSINYQNAVAVMELLKKYGFVEGGIKQCPEILLWDKHYLEKKLKILDVYPEIRALKKNKNAFLLLRYFRTVETRIKYLQYLNIKYVTIRALTGSTQNFERFVRTGVDYTRLREIAYAFEKVLKLNLEEIRVRIKKHPRWRYIDLVTIDDTISFLLKRFAPEDLHDSLQIILYPKETIKQALKDLPELKKPSKNQNYSPKYILALCQYDIERKHHFSGDGVWKYDAPLSNQLKRNETPETSDFSNFDDEDYGDDDDDDGNNNDSNNDDLSNKMSGND